MAVIGTLIAESLKVGTVMDDVLFDGDESRAD